ncbi:MAG: glutathione S-transferase family protein [Thermoleophilaceae bacterium]
MAAKLYVVHGSHPSLAVARGMELKGIPYKRIELPELVHIPHQRLRFGTRTVPAVIFDDGAKAHGSTAILRALDERVPEPRLLPPDPDERARVEELERWGDEVLQPVPRRLIFEGLRRRPETIPGYSEGSRFAMPAPVARVLGPVVARGVLRAHRASGYDPAADLASVPGHLARIEEALDAGVIGGDAPNVADLQIAPSVALLLTLEDVAPLVPQRVADWAERVAGPATGRMPAGTLTG